MFCATSVLVLLLVHCVMSPTTCRPERNGEVAIAFEGDRSGLDANATDRIFIGALLSVRSRLPTGECGAITQDGIEAVETFSWALHTYRNRTGSGINALISGIVFDSCKDRVRMFSLLNDFETCVTKYFVGANEINPQRVLGYVGPLADNLAHDSDIVFDVIGKTHIVTASSLPNLPLPGKNHSLRIYPTVSDEARAMCHLIEKQKWKFAIFLYSGDLYGISAYVSLLRECQARNVDIVYSKMLQRSDKKYLTDVAMGLFVYDKVRVLICLTNSANIDVIWSVLKQNFLFLTPSSYGFRVTELVESNTRKPEYFAGLVSFIPTIYESNVTMYEKSLRNHFSLLNPPITENVILKQYWEQRFDCRFDNGDNPAKICNLTENRKDFKPRLGAEIMSIPLAVDAILNAIDVMAAELCDGKICNELYEPDEVRSRLVETLFHEQSQIFDKSSSGPKNAELIATQVQKIGEFRVIKIDSTSPEEKTASLKFYSQEHVESDISPICPPELQYCKIHYGSSVTVHRNSSEYNIRYHTYYHGWDVAIAVLASVGILVTLSLIVACVYYGYNGAIQFVFLRLALLLGVLCGYLTTYAFVFVPTDETCAITRFGVGFSCALSFGVLLMLTMRWSIKSRNLWKEESASLFKYRLPQVLLFLFVIGVEIVVVVQWLITIRPKHVSVINTNGTRIWICNHYTGPQVQPIKWVEMSRTDFVNHVLALSYDMFLIVAAFLLSICGLIKSRRDSSSLDVFERRCACVVTLLLILWWLAWILLGAFHLDHPHASEFADGCLAYGLLVTATILVMFTFVHLVYEVRSPDYQHMSFKDGDGSVQRSNSSQSHTSGSGSAPTSHSQSPHSRVSYVRTSDSGVDISGNNNQIVLSPHDSRIVHSVAGERSDRPYSEVHKVPHHHSHSHHADDVHSHKNVACKDCGYGYDPTSLHLRHPRTESLTRIAEPVTPGKVSDTSFSESGVGFKGPQSAHGLASTYSTPQIYDPPVESTYGPGRVLKVTRDLTGSHPSIFKGNRSFSDYDPTQHHKKGNPRSRSEEKLGML